MATLDDAKKTVDELRAKGLNDAQIRQAFIDAGAKPTQASQPSAGVSSQTKQPQQPQQGVAYNPIIDKIFGSKAADYARGAAGFLFPNITNATNKVAFGSGAKPMDLAAAGTEAAINIVPFEKVPLLGSLSAKLLSKVPVVGKALDVVGSKAGSLIEKVPGLKSLATDTTKNLVERAGVIGGVHGATSPEDLTPEQRVQKSAEEAKNSMLFTYGLQGLSTAVSGVTSKIGGVAGYINQSIKSNLEANKQKVQNVVDDAQKWLVGFENIGYARAKGLITGLEDNLPTKANVIKMVQSNIPSKIVEKANVLADSVAKSLYKHLESSPLVPHGEAFQGLDNLLKTSFPVGSGSSKQSWMKDVWDTMSNIIVTEYTKDKGLVSKAGSVPISMAKELLSGKLPANVASAIMDGKIPVNLAQDIMEGKVPVSLNLINKIKQSLEPLFQKDPVYQDMYMYLKQYIENKSSDPKVTQELNGELSQLMKIKGFAKDASGHKLLPDEIGHPDIIIHALQNKLEFDPKLAALAATIGYGVFGSLPGGALGLSGYGAYQIARLMEREPKVMTMVSDILGKVQDAAFTTENKKEVFNLFKDAAIKLRAIREGQGGKK